jgi:hypothetical protein
MAESQAFHPDHGTGAFGASFSPNQRFGVWKIDQQRQDERSADVGVDDLDASRATPQHQDRAPLATSLRMILGLSILSWLVLGALAVGIIAALRLL